MLCSFVLKERAQMEAIQALQLQTDAKHRRITSQVIQSNTRFPASKTLSLSASLGSMVSCIARLFLHCPPVE